MPLKYFQLLIGWVMDGVQIILGKQQKYKQMFEWFKAATSRNVTGNYKFHIKSEPENIDTAITISVTAYTDKSQTAMLPCHYKWYRIRNGLTQQSYKFRGNSYVCDSSDLGAVIQAEVTSNDPQYSGTAFIQFGPVKLATQVKKHLLDTLANGSTFIRGWICLSEYQQKECQFKIFEDMIKICHTHSQLNYTFNYSIYEPRIEIATRDQNKLWITFGHNYEGSPHLFLRSLFGSQYDKIVNVGNPQCKMEIKFANKQIRDTFLLTLKAFYTKKQLRNSIIIHKIQQSSFNENQALSLLFEIQSLRSDMNRLYYSNEQKQKERIRLNQEVVRLEKQIEEIVTTYTKMAQEKFRNLPDLNQSFVTLTTKRDEVFGRKCQNLQRENLNLNERIKLLTAEIDQIRFNSSMVKKNQGNAKQNFTNLSTIRVNQPTLRPQMSNFDSILQQFSQSRVTQFKEDSFLSKKLEKVNQQKAQLEKKLEKSFKIIDDLQKKLKTQGATHNVTAVNFNAESRIQMLQQSKISNYSMVLDLEKLQKQNSRLAGINETLKKENKSLQAQLANAAAKIIIKQPQGLNQGMKVSVSRENQLQLQNETLKRTISVMQQTIKNQQTKFEILMRDKAMLQRRVNQQIRELDTCRKSQQVLNRSQHLSMEMDTYNEEQIRVLREHNELLLSQNQKLTKAVEKYMNEARENIKLRKQILQMKEKQTLHVLNPEKSTVKSVYSKSGISHNQFSISELLGKEI